MALLTFTYTPSKGISSSSKPRVVSAQFGDGYSQRVPDGLNSVVKEWDLSFNSNPVNKANSIVKFFEDRKGSEPFLWTPPGETTQYLVICQEWNMVYQTHLSRTVTAKFKQVFDAR